MPETQLETLIAKRKLPRTESWSYKNRIKPLLKELGCRYNRIENCAGMGYPDIDLTHRGVNVKIEMKLAKGRNGRMNISDDQFTWHRRELKAGGNTFILAYWVDKDELHMFKLEPEKYKLCDYTTRLIEKAEDLIPRRS